MQKTTTLLVGLGLSVALLPACPEFPENACLTADDCEEGYWCNPGSGACEWEGSADAGSADAGSADAGSADAGTADAGTADAGTADAGTADAGIYGPEEPSAGPYPEERLPLRHMKGELDQIVAGRSSGEIPRYMGYLGDLPVAYWFLGEVDDSLWPTGLEVHAEPARLYVLFYPDQSAAGRPILGADPAVEGWSPLLQLVLVDVPADYPADHFKSEARLLAAAEDPATGIRLAPQDALVVFEPVADGMVLQDVVMRPELWTAWVDRQVIKGYHPTGSGWEIGVNTTDLVPDLNKAYILRRDGDHGLCFNDVVFTVPYGLTTYSPLVELHIVSGGASCDDFPTSDAGMSEYQTVFSVIATLPLEP